MRVHRGIALVVAVSVAAASSARAAEFRIKEVRSLATVSQLEPYTLAFTDHHDGEAVDPATGLIPFDQWAHTMPLHKRFLSPYPTYTEPTVNSTVNGVTKPATEKLHVYVAEARFALSKSVQSIDLAHYMTVPFLERVDPAIREQLISGTDVENVVNKNPLRTWCEAKLNVLCIQSRYQLEGKLPSGIHLINQLADSKKKIADYLEFKSELRLLSPSDLDQSSLTKLTGVNTPINSVLEQTIFQVNQVVQFGKFLAVFQQDPTDANRAIVTAFVALAIKTRVLENKKQYENVPVLRNLVPAQVLMGRSSFNAGNSLSAGLPVYARNRIKAVAGILDQGQSL
jgi:hypothetical protein